MLIALILFNLGKKKKRENHLNVNEALITFFISSF